MRADEPIAPQDCEHPIERKSLTLDERIKAINDIDQEFDNDVLRGFGEALNIIDELEKKLEDVQNTTENVDLGMENHKLKERIKELEKFNRGDFEEFNDILEKHSFFCQRAGYELWFEKPREIQDKDISNKQRDYERMKWLLHSFHNELVNSYKNKRYWEDKCKELESRRLKWISVEDDEKPKEDEEILFTDGEFIYKGYWTTWEGVGSDLSYVVGSGFFDDVNDETFTEEQITHWMPLPEAPTTEKSSSVKEGIDA